MQAQNLIETTTGQDSIYNVVAYITAYEDYEALSRCISAIKNQTYTVNRIIIVDNSSIPIAQEFKASALVWEFPSNIGISGGLHKFMTWVKDKGYDFVWMFDQDSQPNVDCLKHLIEAYSYMASNRSVGIIAPIPIGSITQQMLKPLCCFRKYRFKGIDIPGYDQPYPCDAPITSGSLLWLNTLKNVPPPDSRLFIDGIDLEYGLRLKRAGYENFVTGKALMIHDFGHPIEVKFLGKTFFLQNYSALRYYYICRNHTYLELSFSQGINKATCLLRRANFLLIRLILISVMRTEHKQKKLWACLRGTYYGLLGNLNKQF